MLYLCIWREKIWSLNGAQYVCMCIWHLHFLDKDFSYFFDSIEASIYAFLFFNLWHLQFPTLEVSNFIWLLVSAFYYCVHWEDLEVMGLLGYKFGGLGWSLSSSNYYRRVWFGIGLYEPAHFAQLKLIRTQISCPDNKHWLLRVLFMFVPCMELLLYYTICHL